MWSLPYQQWAFSGPFGCLICTIHSLNVTGMTEMCASFSLFRLWLQGHVDMVTEKNNDVNHDFFNDPLRLRSDGSWLKVQLYCQGCSAATGWGSTEPHLLQQGKHRRPAMSGGIL